MKAQREVFCTRGLAQGGQTHQSHEAILQLGQLLLELPILQERMADGHAVALHAFQDLLVLLGLVAPQLCLPLQLQQPLFLPLVQATQACVVLHLGLQLSRQALQLLLQLLSLHLQLLFRLRRPRGGR